MKKWNILSELIPNKTFIDTLLANRGIITEQEKTTFLTPPSVSELSAKLPVEFKTQLANAVTLITNAIENHMPIIIHGDYDSDGICATAILYKVLKIELNYSNVYSFIPNRFDHGYGLSKKSVDAVLEKYGLLNSNQKVLFITVDSGITAVDETAYVKSLGHDIIITDHHQKPSVIPAADCLVWHDQIVGTSVSWLLGRALGSKDPQSLAFAAIATVTDLFPVTNFNRSIVKEGLDILNSNPPLGIKQLLEFAGKSNTEITTYDIGWIIGPRLNATGRIVNAEEALNLVLSENIAEAKILAQRLNDVNIQRQDKTIEMYEKISMVESSSGKLPKVIISSNVEYHEGIIGLVASRLTQKYYRPSIVISLNETYGKGSVRSVTGVDIIALLRNFEELFTSLGGHPMAAGFTIPLENMPIFLEKIAELSESVIEEALLVPSLSIDLKIPLDMVNLDFVQQVETLKPFGIGNTEPVFMSENVGVTAINIVGKEHNHLSLRLFGGSSFYKGIFFNGAEFAKDLNIGNRVDIVYTVKVSEFNGTVYADLIIKDMRKSSSVL